MLYTTTSPLLVDVDVLTIRGICAMRINTKFPIELITEGSLHPPMNWITHLNIKKKHYTALSLDQLLPHPPPSVNTDQVFILLVLSVRVVL